MVATGSDIGVGWKGLPVGFGERNEQTGEAQT